MNRLFAFALLSSLLQGCGLAETAASGAAAGAGEAEAARQAQQTEQRVQEKLDEANRKAAELRAQADQQTQ